MFTLIRPFGPLLMVDFSIDLPFSFSSYPLPSGFLSARWSDPSVVIAGRETVRLEAADNFLVTATNNDGDTSEFRNTTSHGLILPNPLWGSDYTFDIKCIYQGGTAFTVVLKRI